MASEFRPPLVRESEIYDERAISGAWLVDIPRPDAIAAIQSPICIRNGKRG